LHALIKLLIGNSITLALICSIIKKFRVT